MDDNTSYLTMSKTLSICTGMVALTGEDGPVSKAVISFSRTGLSMRSRTIEKGGRNEFAGGMLSLRYSRTLCREKACDLGVVS
jgi:hypothetical protein